MVVKVKENNFDEINNAIDELIALFAKQDNKLIVGKMKLLVPEFKSNNSVYESLDITEKG